MKQWNIHQNANENLNANMFEIEMNVEHKNACRDEYMYKYTAVSKLGVIIMIKVIKMIKLMMMMMISDLNSVCTAPRANYLHSDTITITPLLQQFCHHHQHHHC